MVPVLLEKMDRLFEVRPVWRADAIVGAVTREEHVQACAFVKLDGGESIRHDSAWIGVLGPFRCHKAFHAVPWQERA
jgi:hypothetical protein